MSPRAEVVRPPVLCGIDIGGTFTDLVLFDPGTGSLTTAKVLTTPADPTEAVSTGLATLLGPPTDGAPARFVHATTLVTNALIERKGPRTALVTTKGFRDILDLRRENRYDIFDLALEFPAPLVPSDLRWEVAERVSAEGLELRGLDDDEGRAVARAISAAGVQSVAVVFLHSYEHPAHEAAMLRLLSRELPGVAVCRSSEVSPQVREYERTCTTVVNAYAIPLVADYLEALATRIEDLRGGSSLTLMVSDGGTCSPEAARRFPVRLLESGPAAGVLASQHYGSGSVERTLLAFDMGGTTAKMCILRDGRPTMTTQFEAARVSRFQKGSGIPVSIPSIDLVEIGAGGGSVAHVDELGLLQVGPRSAGSVPGPACYGFGGREPTVTDADLLLGYLDPGYFLGGAMALDPDAAREATRRTVADPLGLSVLRAAWGIHDLVNENMAVAARLHIADAGLDPRTFALVVTGGAGPAHGAHLAAKLGIRHVICPPSAGVASAFGLVVAPPRVEVSRTFMRPLRTIDWEDLNRALAELLSQAAELVGDAGPGSISVERIAEMSYVGQTHEIDVPLPAGVLSAASRPAILEAFEARYVELYGSPVADASHQVVGVRVAARGAAPDVRVRNGAPRPAASRPAARRPICVTGERAADVPVLHRPELEVGRRYPGPAVVADPDSSLVVDPGWELWIDERSVVHLTDARQAPDR